MSPIERIDYDNRIKKASDFEILELQHFFGTRSASHLMKDFRLNFWVLLYITHGKGCHYIDFVKYPYKEGSLIILQKNQVHRFQVNHSVQGYILILNEPFFYEHNGISGQHLLDFFSIPYKSPSLSIDNGEGTANRVILDLIYRDYSKSRGKGNEPYFRSLIQSFILSLEEFSQETRELLDSAGFQTYSKFRNALDAHYSTLKTVDDYANLVNVSKKTLNSATRKVAGLSAKEFIIERIILEIKRYISLGELLTYEISDLLGFDEPSNMTKFFKRYTGMSPSTFKHSLK